MQWPKTTWYQQTCDAHAHRQVFYTRETPGMSFERDRGHASVDWTRNCVTKINARRGNGRHLRCIHNNYTSTHFLGRNIFHSWYTREESFERVKCVPLDTKSQTKNILKCTGCNGRRLLDINKNVTRTHSSGILHAWNTRDVIWKRSRPCICWLTTQLFHIAKRKTRQWKTPTLYTQHLHIHALSR